MDAGFALTAINLRLRFKRVKRFLDAFSRRYSVHAPPGGCMFHEPRLDQGFKCWFPSGSVEHPGAMIQFRPLFHAG
jgi:hypothetical protein